MILSFSDSETEKLFRTEKSRLYNNILRAALRKLIQLNNAADLNDMAVPPGNRLEALKGDLVGYYSIRINQQWRIIFQWTPAGAENVAIVDYH